MAENDSWRQQFAEAHFGESLTPGFARNLATKPATIRPTSVESGGIFGSGVSSNPLFYLTPRSAPESLMTALSRTSPPDKGWIGWAVTSVVMLVVAALIGWLIEPVLSPQLHARTQAMAARSVAPGAVVRVPTKKVNAFNPSATIFTIQPIAEGPSSTFEPKIVKAPQLVSHSPSAISLVGESRPVAGLSPRSDRSTPSQAPSPMLQAKGQPSFECRADQGAITALICNDHKLAVLDRQLAARFAALDASVDPATVEALHHEETTFLNARQLCSDKACLGEVYQQRLTRLEAIKP